LFIPGFIYKKKNLIKTILSLVKNKRKDILKKGYLFETNLKINIIS